MRALVVGAGIGGLSAAIALDQAGFSVDVFERARDLDRIQIGGGLHLWTNSMRAADCLGVRDELLAVGAGIERTEYRNWRGDVLADWPVGEIGRRHGVANLGVTRMDLHHVLAQKSPARLHLGSRCLGFAQDHESVTIRLPDGEQASGDVLIGADGIRSTLRRQLLGPADPRYAGYSQWQGVAPFPHGDLAADTEYVVFGPGSRMVLHAVGSAAGLRRLFWAAAVYGRERRASSLSEEDKAELLVRFGGWPDWGPQAIAATPADDISCTGVHDRSPVSRWGEGRVTLLGDAGHLMTTNLGQGATLAMEDAVVLGRALGGAGGDVVAGLAAYEARRVPRTGALVRQSRAAAWTGRLKGQVPCRVRDAVMRRVLAGPALRRHERDMAVDL